MPEFESCLCQPGGMSCRLNKLCRQKCFQQHIAQSELSMCRAYIIIFIASSAQVVMALRLGTISKRAGSLLQDSQWMWWLSLGSGLGKERGRMFSLSVVFMSEFFTITHYFFKNKRKQQIKVLPPRKEHLYLGKKTQIKTWDICVYWILQKPKVGLLYMQPTNRSLCSEEQAQCQFHRLAHLAPSACFSLGANLLVIWSW